jgi:hypothetical protein
MATLWLYWWRKTSDAPLSIISATNWHWSRTTDIPKADRKESEDTDAAQTYISERQGV